MVRKANRGKLSAAKDKAQNSASKTALSPATARRDGYIRNIIPKTLSRVRSDVDTWRSALRAADNVDNPRRARLANLYDDILSDAHLTSQKELRQRTVLGAPVSIQINGTEDEAATAMVNSAAWVAELNRQIHDSLFYGHTLVELTTTDDALEPIAVSLLPRQNVIPERGILLMREDDTEGIRYRDAREYGTWIIEVGKPHDYGLLNKAVPHVLFSRFAQSCWSELCEIYGIPPRYMKTNTGDPEMLDRAETMMRDMGAAAWFIIDTSETFDFAKGADTNGDVYRNLIGVCKEAISVLVNGAVIGQDTVNGNRSKEESSIKLFERLVAADRKMIAGLWNSTIIPALMRIGIFKPGSEFVWQQEEDVEKLWAMVKDLLAYKDIPSDWIEEKFGIPSIDKAMPTQLPTPGAAKLSWDFFDIAPQSTMGGCTDGSPMSTPSTTQK